MDYTFTYDSLTAFLTALEKPLHTHTRYSSNDPTPAFSHTASYAEAVGLARNGWPEGRSKVEAISSHITKQVASATMRPEIHFDVSGDCLDMGRVVCGEPECFMEWQTSDTPAKGNKIVKLVVSICASGGISSDVLVKRGAAICALVESLEASGLRCEVTINLKVTGRNADTIEVNILGKASEAPIQIDQLAFLLVHPSVLRRLFFRFQETTNLSQAVSKFFTSNGYGLPADPTDKGDITLGACKGWEAYCQNETSAVAWVKEQLQLQGIELESAK